jgi:cytochrome c
MIRVLTAALVATALTGPAHAGDAAAGKAVFNMCAACHAVGENPAAKMGPELNGLFGRAAGSVPGFAYSPAMRDSGIVWDEDIFRSYIHGPQTVVPGTRMPFGGIRNDQQIDDLIAFLKQFDASGTIVP